jgi:opacity protein-like surface antigen
MKNIYLCFIFLLGMSSLNAQKIEDIRINKYVDLAATIGESQGSLSGSYVHNWKLWKKRKWEAGFSLRWSSYFGSKTEFITAPARLARTNTTPFLIFFAGQRKETQDTLTVQRPFTNSVNLAVNIGYNFSQRWSGGFNIDLVGFTFGRKSPAILTSNGETQTEPSAKPATFNLLLTGDHDLGSLNSEFFVRYHLNKKWAIRAIYQFLFVEYKTQSVKQVAPDGTIVDRFRNKANTFGLGVSYHFNSIHNL